MVINQKVKSEYYLACADKIIAAMQTRQMECIYFETKKDMLEYLKAVIPAKATAAWGGSMTLYESGVVDLLRGGLCKIIDRDAAKPRKRPTSACTRLSMPTATSSAPTP